MILPGLYPLNGNEGRIDGVYGESWAVRTSFLLSDLHFYKKYMRDWEDMQYINIIFTGGKD